MNSEELDFDSALLKKVTDAYAAKFEVLCGQGCNEVVEEVVRLIEASVAPVAWRKHTGEFWTFREDVPQIRDVYEANGWHAAGRGPRHSLDAYPCAPGGRTMITRTPCRCVGCRQPLGQPHVTGCSFARYTTGQTGAQTNKGRDA